VKPVYERQSAEESWPVDSAVMRVAGPRYSDGDCCRREPASFCLGAGYSLDEQPGVEEAVITTTF